MSGLCGWIGREPGEAANSRAIGAMIEPLTRLDGRAARTVATDLAALGVAGATSDLFQGEGRLVAVCGQTRFADAALAALARDRGAACALAQAFARKGTEALASVSGHFSLAVLDGRSGEGILAVDRSGTHPLCYGVVEGRLVFGSTLDAIGTFPGAGAEVDPQAIYDYVHFHMVPAPHTIHAGRHRLLPGSFLAWRDGKLEVRAYWELRYIESRKRPMRELKGEFLDVLRGGVRAAASAAGTVGTFLSGGTDSSTIAGLLGEVSGSPARTYSIGFEAQGYDEMAYARIAARHFRTRHHEYYVTPADVVSAIPRIADAYDQPFGNSSAVPTYYCAKLARDDGVDVLLGGDGGDELFGGNERYAKQHLYSLYSDLPRAVRKRLVEPLAFLPPEVGILGKVQRYIRNASQPMPGRYDNYNLLERFGAASVFTPEFLGSVDIARPRRIVDEAYAGSRGYALINRMLALDLRFTLADNDLPKVARSSELAGIEARFPMLDDPVVSFSSSLPPGLKLRGTRLRYFFKEALRGFLPEAIIEKTKHGFGLPFGPWLHGHPQLRELALDSLSGLNRRNIVRPEFIDELTSTRVQSHAGYYGTMVWVLMMLEQWFERRRPKARAARLGSVV